MSNSLGNVMCKWGQVRWFRTETAFCWVMHGQPNMARIHYRLLLFLAWDGEEGVHDDEGAGN